MVQFPVVTEKLSTFHSCTTVHRVQRGAWYVVRSTGYGVRGTGYGIRGTGYRVKGYVVQGTGYGYGYGVRGFPQERRNRRANNY